MSSFSLFPDSYRGGEYHANSQISLTVNVRKSPFFNHTQGISRTHHPLPVPDFNALAVKTVALGSVEKRSEQLSRPLLAVEPNS
jgi:hypothetical protein